MEEFIAVAALDEDIVALRAIAGDGSLHFLDIVELAEGTGNVAEVIAHEPYLVIAG